MSGRWGTLSRNDVLVPLGTLGYWLAVGSLRPFLPLRLHDVGASGATIGLVVALSPLTATLLALPLGRLMDRVGARSMALYGVAGMAVSGLGYATASSIALISLLQVVAGVAELVVWVALTVLATDGVGPGSARVAWFSVAWGLGATVGPVVGGVVYDAVGFAGLSVFYIVAGLSSSCLAGVRGSSREHGGQAVPESIVRVLVRFLREPEVRGVLAVSVIMQAIVGLRQSYYPVYLDQAGLATPVIGMLLTVLAAGSLAVRPIAPTLARRHSPMRLLFLSLWLSIAGVALTPAAPLLVILVVGALLMGVGLGINTVLTVEEMARTTRPEERGMAMATRVVANRLGQVAQPVGFGALLGLFAMGTTFVVAAGMLAALTLVAYRDTMQERAPAKLLD
jgi:MFS family permease